MVYLNAIRAIRKHQVPSKLWRPAIAARVKYDLFCAGVSLVFCWWLLPWFVLEKLGQLSTKMGGLYARTFGKWFVYPQGDSLYEKVESTYRPVGAFIAVKRNAETLGSMHIGVDMARTEPKANFNDQTS